MKIPHADSLSCLFRNSRRAPAVFAQEPDQADDAEKTRERVQCATATPRAGHQSRLSNRVRNRNMFLPA